MTQPSLSLPRAQIAWGGGGCDPLVSRARLCEGLGAGQRPTQTERDKRSQGACFLPGAGGAGLARSDFMVSCGSGREPAGGRTVPGPVL